MRRGFVPTVVIVAFALIALFGVTSVVVWKTSFFDSYLPQTVKEFLGKAKSDAIPITSNNQDPSGESSQTTVAEATKDWKTYTNTDLGFSFKYPGSWASREYQYQSSIISLGSEVNQIFLGVYKDFQGGFEHWSKVENKNYYTANGSWIPTTVMYGKDDPDEVTIFGGPYDMQPNLSFFFQFDKSIYPSGLEVFELILSTFKFL